MNTNMNNNPMMMFMNMLRGASNPQQLVMNMVQARMGNNPLFANLLSLAQAGNEKEIEAIARNMMKEQGLDFDKEFNSFRRTMGL